MPHFPPDHRRRPARMEGDEVEEVEGPPFSISRVHASLPTLPPSTLLAPCSSVRTLGTFAGVLKVTENALLSVTLVTLGADAVS